MKKLYGTIIVRSSQAKYNEHSNVASNEHKIEYLLNVVFTSMPHKDSNSNFS